MKTNDVIFTLRDGRTALLRNPREEDVPGVLEYLRISAGETEFILRYPEECDRYTYEAEKALFERWLASDDVASLVCVVDGRVAGNCQITFSPHRKTRHRASIALALIRAFWGLGIGTAMIEEMIRIAKTKGYVERLELEMIEGNARARALYEKMGFRIAGVREDAVRLRDGTRAAEYWFTKQL